MTILPAHTVAGPVDGPPVVLSGSLGSDRRMWRPQVAALAAAGYRVITYDHRGHGESLTPPGPYDLAALGADVAALLDELDLPDAHFAGLSLGGMVGMWLGAFRPKRVRGLVLCCTSAVLNPRSGWADRARLVRAEGTGAVAETVVGRWLTPDYARRHPELVAELRAMVAATPAEGYAACCGAIERMDLLPVLPRITAPTLVISGADDPATPPEQGRLIADRIPGARFEVVEHAAHLGSLEQPAEFTRFILEHLGGRDD
ncbi:3-oxoadipate enol-lactonase [Crossiella sp. SN42]|uniref:3-oxoadipate enol-lactonase n=1 Tax=Crossiella sp. SN42 TaxID=2944808 RepID=UPI00207CDAB6|nr:3-oxoadipate enol-lactonase [Crossiella sp. SN42]MCO1580821.1 3-oxoadipate enol-lactonase [Crossiella sp. SN42]